MSIPDYQTLMLPLLRRTVDAKEHAMQNLVAELATEFVLTDAEKRELIPSGGQFVFANRVGWAKTYLKKAGLLESPRRGNVRITDRGKEALKSNPERIDNLFLQKFPEFQLFRSRENGLKAGEVTANPLSIETLTPDEVMRGAYEQLEASLAAELLQRVRAGSPLFFEKTVMTLLIRMGYGGGSIADVEHALTGGPGDGGIDGVIDQDLLGLDRIYVQAKRYGDGNTVGAGAIRDFFGSLDMKKATKGIFVTASTFSSSAKETAEKLGKRIVLIDGEQVARLMIRYQVGCRAEETLIILQVDELFFE